MYLFDLTVWKKIYETQEWYRRFIQFRSEHLGEEIYLGADLTEENGFDLNFITGENTGWFKIL